MGYRLIHRILLLIPLQYFLLFTVHPTVQAGQFTVSLHKAYRKTGRPRKSYVNVVLSVAILNNAGTSQRIYNTFFDALIKNKWETSAKGNPSEYVGELAVKPLSPQTLQVDFPECGIHETFEGENLKRFIALQVIAKIDNAMMERYYSEYPPGPDRLIDEGVFTTLYKTYYRRHPPHTAVEVQLTIALEDPHHPTMQNSHWLLNQIKSIFYRDQWRRQRSFTATALDAGTIRIKPEYRGHTLYMRSDIEPCQNHVPPQIVPNGNTGFEKYITNKLMNPSEHCIMSEYHLRETPYEAD